MKAVVFTLGCKVNEVESEQITEGLKELGWQASQTLGYADLYILNTCAVTREAEKKSRQLIARARRFNPAAEVYVCGCASQKSPSQYSQKGAAFVCGTENKVKKVLKEIASRFPEVPCMAGEEGERADNTACAESDNSAAGAESGGSPEKSGRTRAFIKIEDGCNNFCTYCIIPCLRGREVSRPLEEIVAEAESCPAPEIVLTGVNISAYSDGGRGLKELVLALSHVKKRVRLGSLECRVIDGDFLNALKGLYDFAPQFHLSLQSGSTAVLRAMNRHYTREQIIEKCQYIYSFFPEAAITCDIIAGFPTESESDFEESISIIKEARLARVHAFAFSPREGTAAFKMKDLPAAVKTERLKRLIEAGERAERGYITSFIGRELTLIVEKCENGYASGYTGNYIKVYAPCNANSGDRLKVRLTSLYLDGSLATVLERE